MIGKCRTILLFFVLVSIVAFSCKKKKNEVIPVDYSYFPMKLKSWVIYDVSYRVIDKEVGIDSTYEYQLKEIVDTIYEDSDGKINYRLERYTRADSTNSWAIADVWSECISENSAQKVEENIRYVKLCFPVIKNSTWNGNAYNTLGKKTYKITSLDVSDTINSVSFDSVLTVTQENILNAIQKFYFIEKYAKHIGLVQKQEISITDVTYPSTIDPIEVRINKATIFYQNIISYGGF